MEARQPTSSRSTTLDLVAAANIIFGILVLFLPYVAGFQYYNSERVSDAAFGPLVIGMAIVRLSFRYRWFTLGNVLFGVWIAVSPFVLGASAATDAVITNLVLGILIALVAASGFLQS